MLDGWNVGFAELLAALVLDFPEAERSRSQRKIQ